MKLFIGCAFALFAVAIWVRDPFVTTFECAAEAGLEHHDVIRVNSIEGRAELLSATPVLTAPIEISEESYVVKFKNGNAVQRFNINRFNGEAVYYLALTPEPGNYQSLVCRPYDPKRKL